MIEHNVVVFDLDDTLVSELDFLKSAYREIAQVVDPDNDVKLFDEMLHWRDSGENVFQRLIELYPTLLLDNLLEVYRLHKPNLQPANGSVALIGDLRNTGNILGLITDGRSITQRNKLKGSGIIHLFDRIIISEEFGSEKPNSANFSNFHDYNGKNYLYIGDNPRKDFISPNNLGWVTIGILDNGTNIHKQDMELSGNYQPKYWVRDFLELKQLLISLL